MITDIKHMDTGKHEEFTGIGNELILKNIARTVEMKKTEDIYVDGVFVFIGQKANTELFRDQIHLDPNGYILAGPNRETNLRGVYAPGDVVQKQYRYLTTAMADGTIAALESAKYIHEHYDAGS